MLPASSSSPIRCDIREAKGYRDACFCIIPSTGLQSVPQWKTEWMWRFFDAMCLMTLSGTVCPVFTQFPTSISCRAAARRVRS